MDHRDTTFTESRHGSQRYYMVMMIPSKDRRQVYLSAKNVSDQMDSYVRRNQPKTPHSMEKSPRITGTLHLQKVATDHRDTTWLWWSHQTIEGKYTSLQKMFQIRWTHMCDEIKQKRRTAWKSRHGSQGYYIYRKSLRITQTLHGYDDPIKR